MEKDGIPEDRVEFYRNGILQKAFWQVQHEWLHMFMGRGYSSYFDGRNAGYPRLLTIGPLQIGFILDSSGVCKQLQISFNGTSVAEASYLDPPDKQFALWTFVMAHGKTRIQ